MWCPLPWNHLSVLNNGDLRLCSHSKALLEHEGKALTIHDDNVYNCDTLKQIRLDFMNGNWPKQCSRCEVESKTKNSRNEKETATFKNKITKQKAFDNTLEDGSLKEPEYHFFDLLLGNQCNLRCAMCWPGASSTWHKDFELFHPTTKIKGNKIITWSRDEITINKLVEISKHLKKITFAGGEPLIIKHHRDLLYKLIESGYSKNIKLEYITSLTFIPDDLFELWKQFENIDVLVSIEAVKDANEAIRYPSKWDDIVNNLRLLDNQENIKIKITSAISILSIEHYADLLNWVKDQNFNKIKVENCVSHLVYTPIHLSIFILEDFMLDNILKMSYIKYKDESVWDYYRTIYNNYTKKDFTKERKQFIRMFGQFKTIQKQDWNTIFPQAANIIAHWE